MSCSSAQECDQPSKSQLTWSAGEASSRSSASPGEAVNQPGGWLTKEVTVIGSLGYLHHEFGVAIDLLADGRIRTEPIHTATVGLSELPEAIARLADDPTSAVKVLVDSSR